MRIIRPLVFLAFAAGAAAPALAQEYTAPRYEALEQQLQTLHQRELDNTENERILNQQRSIMNPKSTAAERGIQNLDFQRKQQALILQHEQQRAHDERDRYLAESQIPNRRITPGSTLAVSQPELYGLPKLPANKFYARIGGRFVTVDRESELVESILPVQPTDPTADVPSGALPPLLPPVPIHTAAGFGLPASSPGQYYAEQNGHFVVVDEFTGKVLSTTSVSTTKPN